MSSEKILVEGYLKVAADPSIKTHLDMNENPDLLSSWVACGRRKRSLSLRALKCLGCDGCEKSTGLSKESTTSASPSSTASSKVPVSSRSESTALDSSYPPTQQIECVAEDEGEEEISITSSNDLDVSYGNDSNPSESSFSHSTSRDFPEDVPNFKNDAGTCTRSLHDAAPNLSAETVPSKKLTKPSYLELMILLTLIAAVVEVGKYIISEVTKEIYRISLSPETITSTTIYLPLLKRIAHQVHDALLTHTEHFNSSVHGFYALVNDTFSTRLQFNFPVQDLSMIDSLDAALFMCFVLICGLVTHTIWNCFKRKPIKSHEVAQMIERIIQCLVTNQRTSGQNNPYLGVEKVRDQLLAPSDRKKLADVWNAAVKIIEEKEMRGRIDIRSVVEGGAKIWRYCPPKNDPQSASARKSAVPRSENPTRFLKVVHTHSSKPLTSGNWPGYLKNLILIRSSDDLKLVQIWGYNPSPTEECVYVKCETTEGAIKLKQYLEQRLRDQKLTITFKDVKD